jgi:NAD(P)-dependent dehydrogenase (short-subunit alcohol dehydrogenase family)
MSQTCVIFGGTGAIGGAISERLIALHWRAVTVSRHTRKFEDGSATHVLADVTSEDSVKAAVRGISGTGPINAVVYAAGLMPDVGVPLSQYSSEDWQRTFATYADGLFYVYKAILPVLSFGGHIVVISSAITRLTATTLPPFNAGHYAAAKAAVDEFCKWARREAHTKGLLLSRLAPGSVRSPASEKLAVPTSNSLPLEAVAEKVVAVLAGHYEIDEQMLAAPPTEGKS